MAPALILLSLLVSTSPLFAVEALVLFGLKEAGAPPVLPEEPRVLPVHRALWAAIESKEEAVQPLSSWAILNSYTSRVPLPAPSVRQPGERMAVNAARVFLAREERRSVLRWHASVLGLTAWLTRVATAPQLMVLYASHASFGRGTRGVDEAAWAWFRARPEELTWGQAALLAALQSEPWSLDPRCRPDRALRRRHRLLVRLVALGVITRLEAVEADAEPLLPRVEACPRE